jgi:hypothetical protein
MRAFLLAALCAALAACGSGPVADTGVELEDSASLIGQYRAASQTARVATGDVSIERGGIIFEKGVVLYTRTVELLNPNERIASDGDSFAAAAIGSSNLIVELRRVTDETLGRYGRSLCGDDAPAYVALAYEEPGSSVTLLVFSGEEPPGPDATQSRLCLTLGFAARDGARTRQGVVL